LNLYIDYLQTDIEKNLKDLNDKKRKYLSQFKAQLQEGITYYQGLFGQWPDQTSDLLKTCYAELTNSETKLTALVIQ
jgi:hypothetical protein